LRESAVAEKLTVFISGTMRDLPDQGERVAATIREMGLEPVWAEKLGGCWAMNQHPSSINERIAAQVRKRLAGWLRDFHPGPGTFITAFCVGATLAQYTAAAGGGPGETGADRGGGGGLIRHRCG